jgi:murein DD-endopeptidase MepM/ murein hydrolase activator NlpD
LSSARTYAPRERVSSPRDLGSHELWERSLARSRQRRRLTVITRAARRRQKRISLALSAALAAGPVIPEGIAAAESGSGSNTAGNAATNGNELLSGQRVVLRQGISGRLVVAAQMRLNQVLPLTHVSVDGIFGPLTRGAVLDFQRRQHLVPTGSIDARTWAVLFNAPVLVMDGTSGSGSPTPSVPSDSGTMARQLSTRYVSASQTNAKPGQITSGGTGRGSGPAPAADTNNGARGGGGKATSGSSSGGGGGQGIAAVRPSGAPPQTSTYVLTNGVALPLPRGYLTNPYVDQGVDYAAPGGTPLYAMGDGVIIGAGISGFGPNAPILKITSGPLAGVEVYYGHAGPNRVSVGQHVRAGEQISQVGYGIVGISTGPHLEIGFYPPGPMGSGGRMLSTINRLLSQHGVKARTASRHAAPMGGHSVRHRRGSNTTRSTVHASIDSADRSDGDSTKTKSSHTSHRAHRSTRPRRSPNRARTVRATRLKTTPRMARSRPAPRRIGARRFMRRTVPSGVRTTSTRRPRREGGAASGRSGRYRLKHVPAATRPSER